MEHNLRHSVNGRGVRAALFLLLGTAATPALAEGLAPHRAFYALKLDIGQGGPYSDAVGGLAVAWAERCRGWDTMQRLAFTADDKQGGQFAFEVRFDAFERTDDASMEFSVQSFVGGRLLEAFEGVAAVDEDGGAAVFAEPAGATLTLPPGTLFPTAHIERLLHAIGEGERVIGATVFDGSGAEALTRMTAAVGAAQQLDEGKGALGAGPYHPVTLAYHPLNAADDVPEFEAQFAINARGVMRALRLDYGDFVLRGTLQQLDALDAAVC